MRHQRDVLLLAGALRTPRTTPHIQHATPLHRRAAPAAAAAAFAEGSLLSAEAALSSDGSVAWGEYVPERQTASNFGKLRIQASARAADEVQLRAMGYLEGWLTAQPIWDHW